MPTLGDIIIWGTVIIGAVPVGKLLWKSYGRRLVSSVPSQPRPEIMSSAPTAAPSEALRPRTDAPADGRTAEQAPALRPATLDTVKALRGHGFTRDEARAFLKTLGWTLGNDTWAKAQSVEDDEIITPYAGRVTKKEFYPDRPDLEYKPLSDSGA
jgi:hypothetical protein